MRYSKTIGTARLQLVTSKIDAVGTNDSSVLNLYSGAQPSLDAGEDGLTLLVSAPLSKPCYTQIVDGVVSMRNVPEAMITLNGTVSYARVLDANGVMVMQLSVGEISTDLTGDALFFRTGALFRLENWTISDS